MITNSICTKNVSIFQYSSIHVIPIFYSMIEIFLSDLSRLLKHQNICDIIIAVSKKISFRITRSKIYCGRNDELTFLSHNS